MIEENNTNFTLNITEGSLLPQDRSLKSYIVINNLIIKNYFGMPAIDKENANIAGIIKDYVLENLETIKLFDTRLREGKISSTRATYKEDLTIKINDENYYICGLIDDTEITSFYNVFKNKVISIINDIL